MTKFLRDAAVCKTCSDDAAAGCCAGGGDTDNNDARQVGGMRIMLDSQVMCLGLLRLNPLTVSTCILCTFFYSIRVGTHHSDLVAYASTTCMTVLATTSPPATVARLHATPNEVLLCIPPPPTAGERLCMA